MKDNTEELEIVPVEQSISIFSNDPVQALEKASELVTALAKRCTGPNFISVIKGKQFPKVEWWTTVGASLGLFPYTIFSNRIDIDGKKYKYEARVEVRNSQNGMAITSAEAICSTEESAWGKRDEYAIKSMAITRATAKAYRIGLSFLATLAGLEPTPAEEIPPNGFESFKKEPEPQKERFTETQRKRAIRIHEYMLADSNENKHAMEIQIIALGKKIGAEHPSGKFNDYCGDQIDLMWKEVNKDVIIFERQTSGKETK